MKRAIAYTRVSTTDQAEFGVSLDAQKDKIEGYAKLYDIELVEIIVDAGESAKSLDRPGIKSCLAALESGIADALLVVKLDRLTRSVRDLNYLIETYFMGDRYSLISVNESLDTGTATGRMILNIMGVISQWERETIGERTSAALQHMRKNGQYTGGRPRYGYTLDIDGKTLIEDPHEQSIINMAMALHNRQGFSLSATAKTLNQQGYKTRGGGQFQAVQVRAMVAE